MGVACLNPVPDAEGPIGSQRENTSVMWIDKLNGEWCYVEEIPAWLADERVALPFCDGENVRYLEWVRKAIRVRDPNRGIRHRHWLNLAHHPYSAGRSQSLQFKTRLRDRKRRGIPPHGARGDQLVKWVDSLSYDFWEQGDFVLASFSYLPQIVDEPANHRKSRDDLLVLGACAAPDDIAGALVADPQVCDLYNFATEGSLKLYPRHGTDTDPVSAETRGLAAGYMEAAISLALAGPHKDGHGWAGKPVVKKVDEIFRTLLNKSHRARRRWSAIADYDPQRDFDDPGGMHDRLSVRTARFRGSSRWHNRRFSRHGLCRRATVACDL